MSDETIFLDIQDTWSVRVCVGGGGVIPGIGWAVC